MAAPAVKTVLPPPSVLSEASAVPAPVPVSDASAAVLLYTSGPTGRLKGARLVTKDWKETLAEWERREGQLAEVFIDFLKRTDAAGQRTAA